MNKEERDTIRNTIMKGLKPLHTEIGDEVILTKAQAIEQFGDTMDWKEQNKVFVNIRKVTKSNEAIYSEIKNIFDRYEKPKRKIETPRDKKIREETRRRALIYYQQKHYDQYLIFFTRYPKYYLLETAKKFYETGQGVVNYAIERIRFAARTV